MAESAEIDVVDPMICNEDRLVHSTIVKDDLRLKIKLLKGEKGQIEGRTNDCPLIDFRHRLRMKINTFLLPFFISHVARIAHFDRDPFCQS